MSNSKQEATQKLNQGDMRRIDWLKGWAGGTEEWVGFGRMTGNVWDGSWVEVARYASLVMVDRMHLEVGNVHLKKGTMQEVGWSSHGFGTK